MIGMPLDVPAPTHGALQATTGVRKSISLRRGAHGHVAPQLLVKSRKDLPLPSHPPRAPGGRRGRTEKRVGGIVRSPGETESKSGGPSDHDREKTGGRRSSLAPHCTVLAGQGRLE